MKKLYQVKLKGLVVKEGTSIYDIKLKGEDNFFTVSTETSREVALTQVGDTVAIKFIQVGDGQYIITNSFENLSLRGNIDNNSESSLEEAGKANDNNDLNVQEDNTEAATDIQ